MAYCNILRLANIVPDALAHVLDEERSYNEAAAERMADSLLAEIRGHCQRVLELF